MRRFLLPLLAAISLPVDVRANIDPKVAEMCMKAVDFQGCVNAMTGKKEGKRIIMDQGVSLSEGNACPANYAYVGGGTCQQVKCFGSGLFLTIGGRSDETLKKYGWKEQCPNSYPHVQLGDLTVRAFNNSECPEREPGIGFNSTCHEIAYNMNLKKFAGLGIKIKKDPDSGLFIVVSVFEGFSGSKGGIKAGDKIISIDAKSTRGMEVWEVTSLIRGEIGTSVNLGISRDGNIINKVFLREEFSNKQKAKVGSKKINCDSPVWKNKPICNK